MAAEEYLIDRNGYIMIGANGLPIRRVKGNLYERMKQERKSQMNRMIGKYVENDFTFVEVNHTETTALFYHHANNKLQDDIVFVSARMESDGSEIEHRILISRDKLLNMFNDICNTPTKYIERGEDK